MRKRWRVVRAKPGELKAQFGKESGRYSTPDLMYAWGGGGADKPDSRIVMRALEDTPIFQGRTLREELELRGYDITTLKFSVQKKPASPPGQ